MGFLSGLLGGGTKVTTTTNAQNTTNVDVQSNITNVLNFDALAEALNSWLGAFSENAQAAATATLGAAVVQAKAQQAASAQTAQAIRQGAISLGWLILGGLGVYWIFKGKRS